MPITIKYKQSLPVGADPTALKKLGLDIICGVIMPLSNGDDATNEKLQSKLKKALKYEAKLFAKYEKLAKSNPNAFKALAKTYLANKRCLLAALFETNANRRLDDQRSLAQLDALANQYDILKKLNEPARVWQEPKASGKGMRVICSFGPVARAAQHMVKKLLRLTYQPRDFQFAKLSFAEKVQLAMHAIRKKGYAHVLEIDITDFFPSFTEEDLIKSLPLPIEAIRQIVLAKGAKWGPHPIYAQYGYISFPPGLPQGSASSAAVADWCIANMPLEKQSGSMVVNHADNFFAFSETSEDQQDVSKALSSGIAGLPGGDFQSKTEQEVTIGQGFKMLGCWLSLDKDGNLEAFPTDTNLKKFRERERRQRQRVYGRLIAASKSQSAMLRIKGLQDFLRYESMCLGWVEAFSFCGFIAQHVLNETEFEMTMLRYTFKISDEELKPLKGAYTNVKIRLYSGD